MVELGADLLVMNLHLVEKQCGRRTMRKRAAKYLINLVRNVQVRAARLLAL